MYRAFYAQVSQRRFSIESGCAPRIDSLRRICGAIAQSGAPSDMNRRPVGTGPFIFEKYVKDESIRYAGNPEYWKPEDVKLSKLVFSIIPEAAVRVQKLKSNE